MKTDDLQFIINRFDHYYDSINNKGQFFLGINTFLLGGIVAGFFVAHEKHQCNLALYLSFVPIALASIISIGFTLKAILPYLKSGNSGTYRSYVYFGSISEISRDEFAEASSAITDTDFNKDLRLQVYQLARGLNSKFNNLKWAGLFLGLQFILIIPFTFILFKILN